MAGAEVVRCALDFGTSNSAVAVTGADGGRPHAFASHWEVLFGASAKVERSLRDFFLSPPSLSSALEVPSEIVGRRPALGASIQEQKLGIPDSGNELKDSIGQGKVLAGFKWSDSCLGASDLTSSLVERARGWYLRELLAELAAFVAKQSQWNGIELRASYPKAFDSAKAASYVGALEDLASWLREETGLACSIGGYVDESTVAILSGSGAGVDCNLAIDVGGGTVDVAVAGPLAAAEGGRGVVAPGIRATSLRLAGHDIAASVARHLAADSGIFSSSSDDKQRQLAFLRYLRREARTHHGEPWFGLRVASAGAAKCTSALHDVFFAISYFAMVQLAGYVREQQRQLQRFPGSQPVRVRVHLCGNGWSLIGLHPDTAATWKLDPAKNEGSWAKQWLQEAWTALREHEPGLPEVELEPVRLPGKEATVPQILVAGASRSLRDVEILPREVLGVKLRNLTDAASYTPMVLPSDAIHCESAWALPEPLRNRLSSGGRSVEAAVTAILLANLERLTHHFDAARPDSPITAAGTYLVGSPLRLLLEDANNGLRGRL